MLPDPLLLQPAAQAAEEDHDPQAEPDDQQDLPEAAQVEVLEALVAEDRALEPVVDVGELADQAAEDHDRQRSEQDERELALAARFSAGDHRRQEDAGGDERGGDEEDRQLHVPGADQVVGEHLGDVDAEEAVELGPVVLRGGTRPGSGAGTAPPSRRRTRRWPAGRGSAPRRRVSGS